MENNIPNVWSTHPAGHVTIETSRILELFGNQKPNEKRNDFLYAVDRMLLDLNHKDIREKHEYDLFILLGAVRYSLSETSIRTFD